MVKSMGEESIIIRVVLFMMVSGIRIEKMGSEFTVMPIVKNLRVIGSTGRNMEKVPIITKMVINTLEIGSKTRRMEMEYWSTLAALSMTGNGLMTKLLIKEKSFMPIKINTRETSSTEKNMVRESITITAGESIRENG
jgi:hypothetical protein